MNSIKIAYRTVIMLGTLVVGGLAYRAYEPQIQQLEPVVTRVQELAEEYWSGETAGEATTGGEQPLALSSPDGFPPGGPLEPLSEQVEGGHALFDSQVQPAAKWDDPPALSTGTTAQAEQVGGTPPAMSSMLSGETSVASIVQRLSAYGVTDYSLSPWGGGSGFYRFQCSAPWGLNGRYAKQFESVAAEPATAAREVLAQVEGWQASLTAAGN